MKNQGTTIEKPTMPEGYTVTRGGERYPFFNLPVGGWLHGTFLAERETKKTKKQKVKENGKLKTVEVDVVKHYFDLEIIKSSAGDDGSKQHNPMAPKAGDRITLSASKAIRNGFRDAAYLAGGVDVKAFLKEREKDKDLEWPTPNWSLLVGKKVFIVREKDGTVKKGEFEGNKELKYTIGFDNLKAPGAPRK